MPNVLREWPTRARLLLLSLPIGFASGCVSVPPTPVETVDPVCPGTRAARADLAAALAETQDERVLMAGAALIDLVDARCAE
jgi:hypothetical protein